MSPVRSVLSFVGLLGLLVLTGCGGIPSDASSLSGQVRLEGQPVESGSIAFQPIEGTQAGSAGAPIAKGVYQIDGNKGLKPGKYEVKIYAPRKTGKQIPTVPPSDKTMDEIVESIPSQYNTKTILRAEVKSSGANVIDFDLKAKK